FRVAAFRIENATATTLVFTGAEMAGGAGAPGANADAPSPLLLEAASWLNQAASVTAPVTVTATARSSEEAGALAQRIQQQLGTLLLGDTARIRTVPKVESDAPVGGAVALSTGTMPPAAAAATKSRK